MEGCSHKSRRPKDGQQPPEAGKGKEGSFPRDFKRSMALPTL